MANSPLDANLLSVSLRLLAAVGLGALLGLNRETRNKPAGLRTHMMVALGASAFTTSTLFLISPSGSESVDPSRIIQGVATGIGFLGAGSILHRNGQVEGLTTAAGIWVVGAIGVACGIGAFGVAMVTTAVAGLTLTVVSRIEARVNPRDSSHS